ncbi:primase C-terminal domain-containing protein [Dyella ginsengisoli]|uniref:Primase C-terminal domain-containing protein n=1 Tax=Dyella ginsengisoli TaxID=363848 RepID=A0ABW8K021_9GAMM
MGAAEKWASPAIDLETARAFLSALGSRFTFQTLDDSGRKRKHLIRVFHGDLNKHGAALSRLNQQGAGVFVMVNAGDGTARKASNVQAIRAVFADLDGSPLAPVRATELTPHIVVESSPGRWHAYWLADGVPLEQFKPMQQAIASRFASDPTVCDLPRVMRLPGFLHNKSAPFSSRIIEQHGRPPYPYAAIAAWLGSGEASNDASARACITPARKLADTIPEGERNSTLFDLACGLVRKGIPAEGVSDRLQRINAARCRPPLCANEVDTIARNASACGSQGFAQLPHALLDAPEWLMLPAASCAIVLAFYRRFDGFNNGSLCVPWSDFKGQHGIDTSRRFYAYLRRAVSAGFLILTAESRNGQTGRTPAMYAIPDKYLAQVSKQHTGPSVKTAHLNR